MNTKCVVLFSCLLLVLTSRPAAGNLLTNGDFSLDNTGFTSQLDYIPRGGVHYGPGYYSVVYNPGVDISPIFFSFGDHTTGTGLMFAADAATTPDNIVWQETVTVVGGTSYVFSGWAASMGQTGNFVDPSPAVLRVLVNDLQIGSDFTVIAQNGQWSDFSARWTDGTSGPVTIKIVDVNTDFVGNDFTMDDLSLLGVPEPSSLVMLAIGIVGLVCFGRRRRFQTE